MTVLSAATARSASPHVRRSGVGRRASRRVAARLAWRETRRRRGRTLLVLLLVALPVAAMTIGSLLVRSDLSGWASDLDADADAIVRAREVDALIDAIDDGMLSDDTTWADWRTVYTPVEATGADGRTVRSSVEFTDIDLDDRLSDERWRTDRGRAPAAADEVWLSDDMARRLGVDVGDRVRFVVPEMNVAVVGVGRSEWHFAQSAVIVDRIDPDDVRPGRLSTEISVDLPGGGSAEQRTALRRAFPGRVTFADDVSFEPQRSSDERRALASGWVASAVALIAVGVVIAAAFATSAQRQLVTVGQLSANGASLRTVGRALSLQGAWTGLLGAAAGVVLGLTAALVLWGRLEDLLGRGLDLTIGWSDLAVIVATATAAATVAASVPARSAARVPVLAALAGRRPVASPPAWFGPVGLTSIVLGVVALGALAGANDPGDAGALAAVAACVLVLFGLVCLSPLIVFAVGAVGAGFGGVVRLASRSLASTRMRSAAVLTAVATVVAVTTAGVMLLDEWERTWSVEGIPDEQVVVESVRSTGGGVIPTRLRDELEATLPDATWAELETVALAGRSLAAGGATIASPELLDAIDAAVAVRAALADGFAVARTGTVVMSPSGVSDDLASAGEIELAAGSTIELLAVPLDDWGEGWYAQILVPEGAVPAGAGSRSDQIVIGLDAPLTDDQAERLSELRSFSFDAPSRQSAFVADGGPVDDLVNDWTISFADPRFEPPWSVIRTVAVTSAIGLVLLVVGIGLSLAAAESRDERDVLTVLGARRRTRVGLAAVKAAVLTTAAVVVGSTIGVVVIRVVSGAAQAEPLRIPWVDLSWFALTVPIVATAVTLIASWVASSRRADDVVRRAD
ncbi:MAG: FtsX-like permease family protein [Actinomycetota bacterium]